MLTSRHRGVNASSTGTAGGGPDSKHATLERARLAALSRVAVNPAREFSNEKRVKREREAFVATIKQSIAVSAATLLVWPVLFPRVRAHIYLYLLCAPVILLITTIVISITLRTLNINNPNATHRSSRVVATSPSEGHSGDDDGSAMVPPEKQKQHLNMLRGRLVKERLTVAQLEQRFGAKYADLRREWFRSGRTASDGTTDQMEFDRVFEKHVMKDYRLLRFLRACDYDQVRAEHLAIECMYCLTVFRLGAHCDDYKVPAGAYIYPPGFFEWAGTTEDRIARWWLSDKAGRLGMFYRLGTFDFNAWYAVARKSDPLALVKSLTYACALYRQDSEYMHEASNGEVDSEVSMVVDMQDFKVSQLPSPAVFVEFFRTVLPFLATCYPELSANLVIVNAPGWMLYLATFIKPLITRVSRVSIQVFGRCYVERHLHPLFYDEFIPKYLGGRLTGQLDNDPYCRDRLLFAGGFCVAVKEKRALLAKEEA